MEGFGVSIKFQASALIFFNLIIPLSGHYVTCKEMLSNTKIKITTGVIIVD